MFVFVNVLDVYVFGIVVDAAMNELTELFRNVESSVSSDVNVEPPSVRFVVEAVVNDPYVVDENANVCSAVHELALPRFREIVELLPPSWNPRVPDEVSDAPTARVDVAVVLSVPFEPDV